MNVNLVRRYRHSTISNLAAINSFKIHIIIYILYFFKNNIDQNRTSTNYLLEWQNVNIAASSWKVVTAGHSHGNRDGYYWSTRNGEYGISTQTISDFPAGNYTFKYEWSADGGNVQSCSSIGIEPFYHKVPPFDWTTNTQQYFSEVSFKVDTHQTCWGYGGEIRLRSLKYTRKQGNL